MNSRGTDFENNQMQPGSHCIPLKTLKRFIEQTKKYLKMQNRNGVLTIMN